MKQTHEAAVSSRNVMSAQDFVQLGLQDVAYVKRVLVDNEESWSIHSADGDAIGAAPNRDVAFAAVRQHDMEPLSVH